MLLLIRKFNISPNTTNPATIYQRPTKKKSGDDFPFTDKFPGNPYLIVSLSLFFVKSLLLSL